MGKVIKIIGKSSVAPDKAMTMLQEENIDHLKNKNKSKNLQYNENDNTVSMNNSGIVSIFGPLSEDAPYLNPDNNYIVVNKDKNGKPKKKVDLRKLIRYTLSQVLPHKAREGKLDELKALGLNIPDDVNQDLIQKIKNGDENAVQQILETYYDGKEGPVVLPLNEERILSLQCASRGTVVIDQETYITNVMKDGSGRGVNLPLASKALATQRAKEIYEKTHEDGSFDQLSEEDRNNLIEGELKNVEDWMKEHGYTWHEADDTAQLQKVPTHLHACVQHAGAVSAAQDKYVGNCYNDSALQQKIADNALKDAINDRKEKEEAYKEAAAACKDNSNKATKKKLREKEREFLNADARVYHLSSHASEKKLAELTGVNAGDKTTDRAQQNVNMPPR